MGMVALARTPPKPAPHHNRIFPHHTTTQKSPYIQPSTREIGMWADSIKTQSPRRGGMMKNGPPMVMEKGQKMP
jgi:hypothetical protein